MQVEANMMAELRIQAERLALNNRSTEDARMVTTAKGGRLTVLLRESDGTVFIVDVDVERVVDSVSLGADLFEAIRQTANVTWLDGHIRAALAPMLMAG